MPRCCSPWSRVLDDDGLIDLGAVEGRVRGIDEVVAAARAFPPDAVAAWCGIEAERIRSLAHEIAGARRAVVYGRIGLCTQEFGTLASWLVEVVNILTGNFAVEGGALFPARRSPRSRPPPAGGARCAPGAGARGSEARPKSWARPRCPASPRRSTRPARAR